MNINFLRCVTTIIDKILVGYGDITDIQITKKKEANEWHATIYTKFLDYTYEMGSDFKYEPFPVKCYGAYDIRSDSAHANASEQSGTFEFKDVIDFSNLNMLLIKNNKQDETKHYTFYKNERDELIEIEKAENISIKYIDAKQTNEKRKK